MKQKAKEPDEDSPLNSVPLDVYKWSDYPEVNEAVDIICTEIIFLKSTPKKQDRDKLRRHVKTIILGLYVTYKANPLKWCGYHRNTNKYSKNTRYSKLHFNYRPFICAVNGLLELGYADGVLGFHDRRPGGKGFTSRLRATEKLIGLIQGFGVRPMMIFQHPDDEIIVLRDEEGNDIAYEDTEQTIRMREDLKAYNEMLAKTYIDFDESVIGSMPDINRYNKHIRRIFNGNLESGGRYYGGWWQNIDRQLRKYIILNGKPVEEFDYSFLHIAMLYGMEGINYYQYQQDPYAIDIGLADKEASRALLKLVFLIMLNAGTDDSCMRAIRKAVIDEPERYPPYAEWGKRLPEILAIIRANHDPIGKYFNSGIGLFLQYQDSKTATYIINRMTYDEHLPILCMHDGFLVRAADEMAIRKYMNEAINLFMEPFLDRLQLVVDDLVLPDIKVKRSGLMGLKDQSSKIVPTLKAVDYRIEEWRHSDKENALPFST